MSGCEIKAWNRILGLVVCVGQLSPHGVCLIPVVHSTVAVTIPCDTEAAILIYRVGKGKRFTNMHIQGCQGAAAVAAPIKVELCVALRNTGEGQTVGGQNAGILACDIKIAGNGHRQIGETLVDVIDGQGIGLASGEV